MTVDSNPLWKTRRRGKARLRWKARLRLQAKLSESTAWETAHLIAMVLNMHLDHAASRARRMVFHNSILLNETVMQTMGAMPSNALMPTNQGRQGADGEPAIQVVLHWRRFNQQRCHGEILSSNKGSVQDPWSLAIANRLRQILS